MTMQNRTTHILLSLANALHVVTHEYDWKSDRRAAPAGQGIASSVFAVLLGDDGKQAKLVRDMADKITTTPVTPDTDNELGTYGLCHELSRQIVGLLAQS